MVQQFQRPLKRAATALGIAAVLALAATAPAQAASTAITSSGPLTTVAITDTLNCAVMHIDDTHGEFFGDTACGTFVSYLDNGTRRVVGPPVVPAGRPDAAFTPVSQTRGGSGTFADPYTITTVVDAIGESAIARLRVTQVDSYVVGENAYRTTTTVESRDGEAHDIVIYAGADCYLGDDDRGLGDHDTATGAVTCKQSAAADSRIEQFIPLTPNANFYYGFYSSVWDKIRSGLPLDDTLSDPDVRQDNGMALSWNARIAPGTSATVARLTNFSPTNLRPLPSTLTAAATQIAPGDAVTLTATVHNSDNSVGVTVNELALALPSGASFVAGSATGASAEPTTSGSTLTIPLAVQIGPGDTATVTFQVRFTQAGSVALALSGSAQLTPVLPSSTGIQVLSPAIIPPVANDDSAQTAYETGIGSIDVLANDSGDDLAVTAVGTTPDGTASINADGTIAFQPRPGFQGVTSFTYTITDRNGGTSTGTITITVLGPSAVVVTPANTETALADTGSLLDDGLLAAGAGALLLGGTALLATRLSRRRPQRG